VENERDCHGDGDHSKDGDASAADSPSAASAGAGCWRGPVPRNISEPASLGHMGLGGG